MGLLVEYTIAEGKAEEQIAEMEKFIAGLREMADPGFTYTGYRTDDPTRFIGVFEFDDDAAKMRFLESAPFTAYRDGSKGRFTGPPATTKIERIASTR